MYNLNEEEGTHYITVELVPGEDLKSFIRRVGQLPVGKVVAIARQIAEKLMEAHSLGVVHRDLKPQNIMVDREGNVKIMDFGIARSLVLSFFKGIVLFLVDICDKQDNGARPMPSVSFLIESSW